MEPMAWHASLPGVILSAAALIGDGAGRVLVVKPNYRDHWTLPGGICEFGESPRAGCTREVAEELGIDLQIGRLLAIDWQPAQEMYGPAARPAVFFIFDGGTLTSLSAIRLQPEELDDCQFVPSSDLDALMLTASVPRIAAAIAALPSSCVGTGPGLTLAYP
jgi:8-oxo-dGTP diphosphatase